MKLFPINANKVNPTYMDVPYSQDIQTGKINIIGFEFDGTACFRKGTKVGPNAFRRVSYGIETYSPYLDRDIETKDSFVDLGNLPVDSDNPWQQASESLLTALKDLDLKQTKTKIVTLGGEHSISYAPIKKYLENYHDLVLIHLDAHADLRDGYEGYHFSHASIIRRCLDHFHPEHKLIQYGIRSGTQEEFIEMKKMNSLITSRQDFLNLIGKIPADRPIYLTLDLDYFDPSYLPGTGTPEPGGEDFHSFISLMKILSQKNFVGADVVELSPELDSTDNSSVFASKVLREIVLALA